VGRDRRADSVSTVETDGGVNAEASKAPTAPNEIRLTLRVQRVRYFETADGEGGALVSKAEVFESTGNWPKDIYDRFGSGEYLISYGHGCEMSASIPGPVQEGDS